MADKGGKTSATGIKPVPMKLFATWEVEKSSPNCIPRLCTLTLTRLVILKHLENELTSVIVAVKMQSSKRILRSNEIIIGPNGLLDTELDLSFSLQYPHFLKRDGNKLQVLLQRRKKYKNRTILGYKTLAMGQVNMAQVLQRSVDKELNLYSDPKERNNTVAQVMMLQLASQPVDHDENGRHKLRPDQSPDVDMSDEDEVPDDPEDWSNDEMSDSEPIPEDVESRSRPRKPGRGPNRPAMSRQRNIKQKFIALLKRFKVSEEVLDSEQDQDLGDQDAAHSQEIEDLFDELEDFSNSEPEIDTISVLSTPKPQLRPFFPSRGSGLDLDVPRVSSARHYGATYDRYQRQDSGRLSDDSSKRYDSDSHLDNLTDAEQSDTPCQGQGHGIAIGPSQDEKWGRDEKFGSPRGSPPSKASLIARDRAASMREKKSSKREKQERRNSAGNAEALVSEPRKVLLDQLSTVLSSDESLPDSFILVNTNEWQGQLLAQILQDPQHRVICTCSSADVKASVTFVVNKIQKLRHGRTYSVLLDRTQGCNSNSRAPLPIKIAIAGGDGYANQVLRPYVEQFSSKSHDWQTYIKFLFIPLGSSILGKYLCNADQTYASLFLDSVWKETFDKSENPRPDTAEIVNRISRYLNSASSIVQLPIAEAMITYKEKSTDEESSQIFVPFIMEVRIGPIDLPMGVVSTSVDLEDNIMSPSSTLSSSPPQSQPPSQIEKTRDNHTPPSSPNVNNPLPSSGSQSSALMSPSAAGPPELLELQLDYWTGPSRPGEEVRDREKLVKKESKASLKTSFKSVQVFRLPQSQNGDLSSALLSMVVVTKEKKQKIMRIGKKSKESESKSQVIEGISRLICTSKSQSHPLTVTIDGVDWMGVKFFQLSSQWQTHMKHIPILVFDPTDTGL